jgi:predicted metal-dependent peptidase
MNTTTNKHPHANNYKGAVQRLIDLRLKMLLQTKWAFFSVLSTQLKVVDGTGIVPTFGVDGVNLYVNPTFADTLSDEEFRFVIMHEVMHIALKHIPRLKHRDQKRWNRATDYAINWDLQQLNDPHISMPKVGLIDKKYANMSADDIYVKLQEDDNGKQAPKQGQGKEQGQDQDDADSDFGGFMMPQDMTSEQQEELFSNIEIHVKQAVAAARKAGSIPGSVQRAIQEAEPKVNWRSLLRTYITSCFQCDETWNQPSRRSAALGIYLPSKIPDATSHLVFCIDTSGSIMYNARELDEFVSEVQSAVTDAAIEKITIIWADAKVQSVDVFENGEQIKAVPKGGGGTCFKDTFRYISENCADANAIVYLTDMETSSYGSDPGIPTIWASNKTQYREPPFGEVIVVA